MVNKPSNPFESDEQIANRDASRAVRDKDDIYDINNVEARNKNLQAFENRNISDTIARSNDGLTPDERREREYKRNMERLILQQTIAQQIEAVKIDLARINAELGDAYDKRTSLADVLKSINEKLAEFRKLEEEQKQVDDRIAEKEKELATQEKVVEEAQKQLDKTEEANRGAADAHQRAHEQTEQAKARGGNVKDAAEHEAHCFKQYKSTQAERDVALAKRDEELGKKNAISGEIDALKSEKSRIADEIKKLEKEHSKEQLEKDKLKTEQDIKDNENKIATLEAEKKSQETKLAELESQIPDDHEIKIEQLKSVMADLDTRIGNREEDLKNQTKITEEAEKAYKTLTEQFTWVCKKGSDIYDTLNSGIQGSLSIFTPPAFDLAGSERMEKIMNRVEGGQISAAEVDSLTKGLPEKELDDIKSKLENQGILIKATEHKIPDVSPNVPHAEHVTISSQPKSEPSILGSHFAAVKDPAPTILKPEEPGLAPKSQFNNILTA